MLNFESPDSDYALLPLIAVATITTLPLWILLLIKKIITKKEIDNSKILKFGCENQKNDLNQTENFITIDDQAKF